LKNSSHFDFFFCDIRSSFGNPSKTKNLFQDQTPLIFSSPPKSHFQEIWKKIWKNFEENLEESSFDFFLFSFFFFSFFLFLIPGIDFQRRKRKKDKEKISNLSTKSF